MRRTRRDGLLPIAERGEKILFCEPSCLSAVKEDAPSLLRGDLQQRAKTVAEACMLFEEFAAKLDLPLRPGPGKILLHGHCHQKSMGMLPATVALLSRIPNATVVDLDAGCCGMAGSFGYTSKHYEVSEAIAEPQAASGSKGDGARRSAGRARHFVPPPGGRTRRRQSRPPGSADPQPADRSGAMVTVCTFRLNSTGKKTAGG